MRSRATDPVGFFDSGRGGLCVLEAFRKRLPRERTIYLADTAHCPYGNKPPEEIVARAKALTEELLAQRCKLIVVACNTATAAGADHLVLGCTHFPHLKPLIESVAAGRAKVIDPSDAVARQAERLLAERNLLNFSGGTSHVFIRTSLG